MTRISHPDIRLKYGNGGPNDSRIAGWASIAMEDERIDCSLDRLFRRDAVQVDLPGRMKHRVRLTFTSGPCLFGIAVADFGSEFVTWQSHPVH